MKLKVRRPLSVRLGQSSCGLLALPQEDLPVQGWNARVMQASQCWFTGRPIAMFHMAAVGFAFACVCVCEAKFFN